MLFHWISLLLAATGLALLVRADLPFLRNPKRRVPAKIIRHHRTREDGATMYSAIFLFADEKGHFIEVRDQMYTPFPKPVIGEMIEIIHPEGLPEKARIPHPWFRMLAYGFLGYVFVVVGLKALGLE